MDLSCIHILVSSSMFSDLVSTVCTLGPYGSIVGSVDSVDSVDSVSHSMDSVDSDMIIFFMGGQLWPTLVHGWRHYAVEIFDNQFIYPMDIFCLANSGMNIAQCNCILLDAVPTESVPPHHHPPHNESPYLIPVATIDDITDGDEIVVWHGSDFAVEILRTSNVLTTWWNRLSGSSIGDVCD